MPSAGAELRRKQLVGLGFQGSSPGLRPFAKIRAAAVKELWAFYDRACRSALTAAL